MNKREQKIFELIGLRWFDSFFNAILVIFASYILADIDECSTGAHECSENAECLNSVSSYQCSCRAGYEGDGKCCQGTYKMLFINLKYFFNKIKYKSNQIFVSSFLRTI